MPLPSTLYYCIHPSRVRLSEHAHEHTHTLGTTGSKTAGSDLSPLNSEACGKLSGEGGDGGGVRGHSFKQRRAVLSEGPLS